MSKVKGGKVVVVVGGQWGSEAKGTFIGHYTRTSRVDYAVRTGSINAGHTVEYEGEFYAMQQIPVSWVKPDVKLVIGRGAYIDPDLLYREIALIEGATGRSIRDRLYVDLKCGTQLPKHTELEEGAGLHGRMGSTAHGCMEAQIDRMRRSFDYETFASFVTKNDLHVAWQWADTEELLNTAYDNGNVILLEGTQGTGLDFLHGEHPYVTTRPTIASHWMTEAGLSPNLDTEIVMVCRTFPIRVAGNSGPMGTELSWPDLARRVGVVNEETLQKFEKAELEACEELGLPARPHLVLGSARATHSEALSKVHNVALSKLDPETIAELRKFFEITTVTKKLRRIAEPDDTFMAKFVRLNRPDYVVLNFLNYIHPWLNGVKNEYELRADPRFSEVQDTISKFELAHHVFVQYAGINKSLTVRI